jgi:hypothetical protein
MITGETKSKIDRIWDTMWSGGISNPLSVIEQLTYLLFIKRLDELHTLKEQKANRTQKPIGDPVFTEGQDHLRWSRFKKTAPEQMFATARDEVSPFIHQKLRAFEAHLRRAATLMTMDHIRATSNALPAGVSASKMISWRWRRRGVIEFSPLIKGCSKGINIHFFIYYP